MSTHLRQVFPRPSANTPAAGASAAMRERQPSVGRRKAPTGLKKSATRSDILAIAPIVVRSAEPMPGIVRATGRGFAPAADWPTGLPMMPNLVSRSALFSCVRTVVPNEPDEDAAALRIVGVVIEKRVASTSQYKVVYRGEILNQADGEVWQVAILTARQAGAAGLPVTFSLNEWCRILNRRENDQRTNTAIVRSLKRLMGAFLMVENRESGEDVWVNLIERVKRDPTSGRYMISINPLIVSLFTDDVTEIDLRRKARLRSSLAKWMHDYFSTHSHPIPMALDRLQELSGMAANTALRNSRIKVREAIEELQTCEPPLFAKGTAIEGDKLHVVKATNSLFRPPKPIAVATVPPQAVVPLADATPDASVERDRRSTAEKAAARQRSRVAL
ncbi:plasmid replication initiator TrfA [Burkholderia gladioli]|uniref:plasmid replication initiator TrfA n=1 Tax=Burkholderia gladioli TaxID=28095 RepID=UPI001640AA0C|nr:plasmid replication initiator TrfA [Burkholderia gladioli]